MPISLLFNKSFESGDKSCATNLIETIDIVSKAFIRGFSASIVFFDFLKAFDRVSHCLLLIKLEAYGFREKLLDWLKSFPTYRKQRVACWDHTIIRKNFAFCVCVLSGFRIRILIRKTRMI